MSTSSHERPAPTCGSEQRPDGLDRRQFLKLGAAALGGVLVSQVLPGPGGMRGLEAFTARCTVAVPIRPMGRRNHKGSS